MREAICRKRETCRSAGALPLERLISAVEPLDRLFPAARLLDEKTVVAETLGDGGAQRRLVVHDQQMFLVLRHLVGRAVF